MKWLCLIALVVPGIARAHEVRPAYLEIIETAPGRYRIVWKQPTMGEVAVHLVPHLSNGWLERPATRQYVAEGSLVRTWVIDSDSSVVGRIVRIEGLEHTITDVLVRVRLRDARRLDLIVHPESPSVSIDLADGRAMGWSAFVLLGIRHILTGPDHLLFVLGLLIIVGSPRPLLKTVSAFTVAHSVTLGAATLGLVSFPTPLINALIALSILFVAPEAIRAQRGGTSLTIRYPWIVAFGFGLLHGMGFASGLTSLGLDRPSLAGALVSFNVGVESGQLGFIALMLSLRRAFRLMEIRWPRAVQLAPAYAIGILGAMWTFQYSALAFGGTP